MEVENQQADALIGLKINSNVRHCSSNVQCMRDFHSLIRYLRRGLLNVPDIPRYKTWMNDELLNLSMANRNRIILSIINKMSYNDDCLETIECCHDQAHKRFHLYFNHWTHINVSQSHFPVVVRRCFLWVVSCVGFDERVLVVDVISRTNFAIKIFIHSSIWWLYLWSK